ncbi:MAG: 3-oxoacyl-[acyl-carrier-protein] synthase [Thermosediminibacterales bacterium]|nr:3-oxoacyl-[acyl-carrier-protein] synthase [Thermosediminibacterales bacterium]MDK2835452.1 3-oxoacyl-[acyl-carrier-protein] synthase [Thermosediminibacterales bacterium]
MAFAGITGIGACLPEKILTNFDLEKMVETSDEWIRTRTGIKERRIADENTAASDLATEAAKRALEDAGLKPEDIDMIIVATVTADMPFPATACIVQKNIKAVNAAAFDLEAGCTGFIYSLSIATQFIENGTYKNILVIASDTLTKITDFKDRNTCILFGDGAGAIVVSRVEEKGILSNFLKSNGNGGDLLYIPAGGSRKPTTIETVRKKQHYIQMNGSEVFKFAVKVMGEAAESALKMANVSLEDVKMLIPHQANQRIIDAAARRLNISRDKVYINLDKYGNMSSATVPIALEEAVKMGKIKKGDIIVLVAFGAGLTWGANVIKWIK